MIQPVCPIGGDNYEIVVGNIGTVYAQIGGFEFDARKEFNSWVAQSKMRGRAWGEPVTLFKNNEIIKEYAGTKNYND